MSLLSSGVVRNFLRIASLDSAKAGGLLFPGLMKDYCVTSDKLSYECVWPAQPVLKPYAKKDPWRNLKVRGSGEKVPRVARGRETRGEES